MFTRVRFCSFCCGDRCHRVSENGEECMDCKNLELHSSGWDYEKHSVKQWLKGRSFQELLDISSFCIEYMNDYSNELLKEDVIDKLKGLANEME